jgi:glyoxylase-like metal-dependent hydrolase (beta-lactamase superfamily II)
MFEERNFMLLTKMFEVGMLSTNCYIASCSETLAAIIIDPGLGSSHEAEAIFTYLNWNGLKLKSIVNTHGHPDHSCGNAIIKDAFDIPICIHEGDAYMLGESGKVTARYFGYNCVSPPADIKLREGDLVKFGNVALKVLHSPGHSNGSILLLGEKEVFTGDTLFAGSIGRTDFPGSSDNSMHSSLEKMLGIPGNFVIYPGHGPTSTINEEKQGNPFLISL